MIDDFKENEVEYFLISGEEKEKITNFMNPRRLTREKIR